MMNPADLSTPLTDTEYDKLDAFLLSLDHDDAMLDVSEFDGFITAVVSGPDMVPPSEWLPVVWGGEANAPEWASEAEFQEIFGLMIRHMSSTAGTLMQEPVEFEPCFLESKVRGVIYWVVDEWCAGYMKGVGLRSAWLEADPEMETLLAPIRRFADADGWSEREGQTDDEIRRLQEQIAPAARSIHTWWLARRTPAAASPATYIRPEPKVGRNDPCPCGSGRKYKRCCGAH